MQPADRVQAVRGLIRAFRDLERSCGDLSLAQYRVLASVEAGDARPSHISQRLAIGKPAVSNAVEGLCQRGLLERTGEDDQRVVALRLTAEGTSAVRDAEARLTAWLDDVVDRAGGQPVIDALVALNQGIEQYRAERMDR